MNHNSDLLLFPVCTAIGMEIHARWTRKEVSRDCLLRRVFTSVDGAYVKNTRVVESDAQRCMTFFSMKKLLSYDFERRRDVHMNGWRRDTTDPKNECVRSPMLAHRRLFELFVAELIALRRTVRRKRDERNGNIITVSRRRTCDDRSPPSKRMNTRDFETR